MIELLIDDSQNIKVGDEIISDLSKVMQSSLESEGINSDSQISISFIDDYEIKILNFKHRKINKTTDVLSFPLYSKIELEELKKADIHSQLILGDIVISVERAADQAKEYGHSFKREMCFLVCHSMFHLMGYDHINEDEAVIMRAKEQAVLEKLNINR